jgi:hypothetical protein
LEIFTSWSGQTYEGERVSAGVIVGAETSRQAGTRTNILGILRLDDAVVLRHNGRALAAGAILELGGADRGNLGGRSAGAKALSRFGLGIKVSEDGMISCYKPETGQREPCFKVA